MKHEVTFELIEDMAECIFLCSWVSKEEIAAYMKACITNDDYEPKEWSEDGRGEVALNRDLEA